MLPGCAVLAPSTPAWLALATVLRLAGRLASATVGGSTAVADLTTSLRQRPHPVGLQGYLANCPPLAGGSGAEMAMERDVFTRGVAPATAAPTHSANDPR